METPQPKPLTDQEREELVQVALNTEMGKAVQGAFLKVLALGRWFSDVDPDTLLPAMLEAPYGGLESSQAALDEMSAVERVALLDESIDRFKGACVEAVDQLEALALAISIDPRQIDGDDVAKTAGLPIVAARAAGER